MPPAQGEQQQEIIDFLSEGKSYGLPGAPVRRIETHWSVIFLVAGRAYKLKRQLAFSLLDYMTVEKREKACRAELEVNADSASDLYLGVRKIAQRADGTLAFDDEGPAADWVVFMRRFDQADLLNRLADARRLDGSLARSLADEIAAFHARVEATPGWGGAAAMRAAAKRWREHQGAVEGIFEVGLSAAYAEALGRAIEETESLLEHRRRSGKVRRGHGDLRLANVCLLDGRLTLFDAIEFSAELSSIDVLYDLAFVLMDLHHHALPDLANLVLNRYLDISGDVDGLALVPLFWSFRAAMRAQMLAEGVSRRPASARPRLAAEARSLLGTAMALLSPQSPRLVAIGGLESLAKADLAAALAAELGRAPSARIISEPLVRGRVLDLPPTQRLPPSAYDDAIGAKLLDALCREAAGALASGITAVVDAEFLDAKERLAMAEVARAAAVPFIGLWFDERDGGRTTLGAREGQTPLKRSDAHWLWIDKAADPVVALAAARSLIDDPGG